MSAKRKTAEPAAQPPTLDAIAKALGITVRRVSVLLTEGMPRDIAGALAWREAQQDDSSKALRKARLELIREQTRKARLAADQAESLLLDAGEAREEYVRRFSAARGELLKMAADLPPQLEGLPAAKMQPIIRECVVDVLRRLAEGADGIYIPKEIEP
jgi:hypothetical protein